LHFLYSLTDEQIEVINRTYVLLEAVMIGKILNIGSAFDWITPSVAFIQDAWNGPVGDFGIPANSSWGPEEIKRLLGSYDVHVWGLMLTFEGDVLLFTVKKRDAELTYYLLRRMGIPIIYSPVDIMDKFS
jgi:hypothetical protein